jgi:hypothetical protein
MAAMADTILCLQPRDDVEDAETRFEIIEKLDEFGVGDASHSHLRIFFLLRFFSYAAAGILCHRVISSLQSPHVAVSILPRDLSASVLGRRPP